MLRYLALVWDPADSSRSDAARLIARDVGSKLEGMSSVVSTKGLIVWSSSVTAERSNECSSRGAAGVVLGRLFDRKREGRAAHIQTPFTVTEDSNIAHEGGRGLLENYWGRYVAFVRSEQSGTTWVLRDPSGGLPCFFIVYRGVFVFFSHLEDCLALQLGNVSVNWQFIAAYIVNPALQQSQTGLRDVSEVLKGEGIEIRGSACTRKLYWNPLHIARTNPVDDSAAAIQALRETVQTCVATWASSFNHILHRISGGLDSSIVLACLSNTAPRASFAAVTYYDDSIWGDEREFARLAARHANCDLIERMHQPARVDFDSVLDVSASCSPTYYLLYFAHQLSYSELARQQSADALFGGHGGDAIFFREPGQVLPVADYLYHHPFGARLPRVAFDTARASGRAIWNVLSGAFTYGVLRRPFDVLHDIHEGLEFVEADVMAEVNRSGFLRPSWLNSTVSTKEGGVPPAKLRHIEGMNMPEWAHQPYALDGDPDEISPLLSQPVAELILRIPTYLFIEGGRERMLARRAFTPDLPPELIARVSKGGQNDFSLQMFRKNQRHIRELVLDGQLCKQGMLNRRKLEAVLDSECDSNTDGLMEVLHTHLSAEIWLQSLSGKLVLRAA